MGREEQIIEERLKKLAELKKAGINPYPYSYKKTDSTKTINSKFSGLKNGEKTAHSVKIAGRLMNSREFGKIAFCVIQDGEGKIQLVFQEPDTPKKVFDFFKKYIDTGDFLGAEGPVIRTQRGELSVLVKNIELLSKSTLPLPEKWHGLQDKEERYRKRYLDLLINSPSKEVFEKREKIIEAIREFLKSREFHEVDTPYLQTVYGGASARPFKTNLNALNIDLFLSISPELYLKRLIVGGYEKVYSIARNFRNEGIDRWHNPEFTMMEVYQAYADYNDMMELTEDLFEFVCRKVNNSTKVKIGETEIDFKKPWTRITMLDAIKKYAKIDAGKLSVKELLSFAQKHKVELKGTSWGMLVQSIFEHFCEKEFIQPTFVIDHPKETTPLCKIHREDPRLIERFEPFCMGAELANAYSELNDPVVQKEFLEEQQKMLSQGDEEANPYDKDFVNSLEIGMPPTGGLGIGIDRMIILLTASESIRDVILFPFMRPEGIEEKKDVSEKNDKKAAKKGKSK